MWLKHAFKQVSALRKTNLRVDLRVYAADPAIISDVNQASGMVDALLHSAIMRGLDVIGVVSPGSPQVGWAALKLANEKNLDLWVVPGEDYSTSDGMKLMVYFLEQPMPLNLDSEMAIKHAHDNHGFVMACHLSKRFAKKLETVRHTAAAPDAIEIYNAINGVFSDIQIPPGYPLFVTSGAASPTKLEQMKTFTVVPRSDMEGMGLLSENYGIGYQPEYMEKAQAEQAQKVQLPDATNFIP